jgi:hypothetical protein
VASYRDVVYRVKVFVVMYPFGPLPSTDPDKRLTWDQVVQLAKKVQVEKNGVVEGWGFAFQQYDRPCPTRRWRRPCAARARNPRH